MTFQNKVESSSTPGALGIGAKANAANDHSLFGPLDKSILSAGRRAAVPMPGDMFGAAWPNLQDIAAGTGSPVDYVATGFISACASLIGGKRKATPWGNWKEPCILWMGAVGDPSSNKSPALDAITAPLRKMEKAHAENHLSDLQVWEASNERATVERDNWKADVKTAAKEGLATPAMPDAATSPDEPERRRLIITDATPEAVGSILASNHVGTLHFRDELAGWLTSFDRYSPGGREFWLEAYGGRNHVVDRKGTKKPLIIEFNGVSVVGGIQPEKLAASLLASVDDGLVPRFLWSWPEPIPFQRPTRSGDLGAIESIYEKLDSLPWSTNENGERAAKVIPLSDQAASLFAKWALDNDTGLDDSGSLYKNFCGKLRGTALRLSTVCEYCKWAQSNGPEPEAISWETLADVLTFIDDYAKPMAQRVYGDASLPKVERNAAVLARYFRKHQLADFNAKNLRRTSGYNGPKDAAEMNEALELLIDCNWIAKAGKRQGDSPGRLSSDYLVNQSALGAL